MTQIRFASLDLSQTTKLMFIRVDIAKLTLIAKGLKRGGKVTTEVHQDESK